MAETILTRRVLYDLVWSKPMTKVSEELGLSDVGLKKVCTKHRVPTPTRGYWAKKDAGKPVKQTRLYETADPQDERIVIRGQQNHLPSRSALRSSTSAPGASPRHPRQCPRSRHLPP